MKLSNENKGGLEINSLKIAIIGYGQMGHEIENIAKERGHDVVAIIDPVAKGATAKDISKNTLNNADVAIDFTMPKVAMDNIKDLLTSNINVVFGTTGWYDHMEPVKKLVKKSNQGFIWSGNFSIGVNLFFKIIKDACKVMDQIKEYDAFAYELHHNKKKDSPSGTAEMIGNLMLENLSRKNKLITDKLERQIKPDELHLASVRGGSIPGTHVIGFDSKFDTIELKHTARSRQGFALGAVMAAEWVKDKKGFYQIDDFMKSLLD